MNSVSSPRTDARRAELVSAAAEVIISKGYRHCAVADITTAAGVAHGTFYNYFESRREILDGVIDFEFDALVVEVIGTDSLDGVQTLPEFSEQFARMLRRIRGVVERTPGLIKFVLYDAAAVDQQATGRLLGLFERISEFGTQFVDNGIRRGFLREDIDVAIAADTITSMLSAIALIVLEELENGPVADAAVSKNAVDGIVDFVVHALT